MPGSKYERELRFIESETKRLGALLKDMREMMPVDPVEATKKAADVMGVEEKIGDLLARKREIEDYFISAGMEVPDPNGDFNQNVHQNVRDFSDEPRKLQPDVKPTAGKEELTAEIESVTDELMAIEIKMLRADMNSDQDEKQKLSMMASSLRSRRDSLVEQVKAINEAEKTTSERPVDSDPRVDKLEADLRAVRSQVGDLRIEMSSIREDVRKIMDALRIEDDRI